MKYLLITLFLIPLAHCGFAQDTNPTPAGPPVIEQPSDTLPNLQKEDREPVDITAIPPAMKDTLLSDAKYKGWENAEIYFERNTGQFIVHIQKENSTHTYRFDKEGQPIPTDQAVESTEQKH